MPDNFNTYYTRHMLTFSGGLLSAFATILMGTLLCIAMWQVEQNQNIWIWLLVLLTLVSIGFLFSEQKRLIAVFVSDLVIGVWWISFTLLCFPATPDGLQVFFALVILGAALSAAIFGHRYLPASLAAIGLALPIVAIHYFLASSQGNLFLPLFLIFGWFGAIGLAWFLHKAFLNLMVLQYEKDKLLQSVEDKVEELDQLRKFAQLARQEADTANAAKSRFLAHASHDLRQPLHAVGLLLATIPDKGLNRQAKQVLGKVGQSLDVLSDLFDSLLDVAMLDTGRVEVNIAVFPIDDVLEQITRDFADMAKGNNVELRSVRSSLMVRSDPVILRRMVQNLVSNAIAHAHNSRVLLGVRRQENTLRVEVHDTGKGIAPEDQERIFEEFTKVGSRKPKNDMPGLGLGLAIVQRLSNIIDSHISLKSTVGTGSIFSIENLKRAHEVSHTADISINAKPQQPKQNARIVILDDDIEILKATEKLVLKWGFVPVCFTGYDADTISEPDIILCDYELMQSLNGVEVIGAIRRKFGWQIPAILITGKNSDELVKQENAQNIPVLFKPVKPVQLRSMMLTALLDDK